MAISKVNIDATTKLLPVYKTRLEKGSNTLQVVIKSEPDKLIRSAEKDIRWYTECAISDSADGMAKDVTLTFDLTNAAKLSLTQLTFLLKDEASFILYVAKQGD